MKPYLYVILACLPYLLHADADNLSEHEMIEREQVRLWESKLETARSLESQEKIEALWLGLRNMGWRRSFPNHSNEVDVIYLKLQQELLSTPGHAQYFADEVERLIADPKNAHSDVRQRRWYLRDTLVHLPSPETIQVLGSYLYDERYSLDPNKNNSGAYGPTSHMVATALRNIGLRESEEYIRTQGSSLTSTLDMDALRRWWELVKSGERTFSFKGQDVEYRFKPDGTWETIPIANPPDDGPQPMEAEPAVPVTRESPSQPVAPAEHEEPTPWRWIWIPIAVVLIAGFFGLRIFHKRQS